MAPCSWWEGRGRGWGGQGRVEGLLVAFTAQGLPVALSRTQVLPRRDQSPDPSEHRVLGWAQPSEQEEPPVLQEVAGSRAELIPVTLIHVRASRD